MTINFVSRKHGDFTFVSLSQIPRLVIVCLRPFVTYIFLYILL